MGRAVALAFLLCLAAVISAACGDSPPSMNKLRKLDQFSYGHLLVDGAVEPFEVFRATFGGPLVCGRKEMAMASPLDACSELSARDVAGRFVVAARGTCTFVDKAHNAFAAGAAGLIVTNHEGGMLRMPMGNQDGLNISIPVVMANNHTGQVLRAALGAGVKLIASMHPKTEPCLPSEQVQQWMELDRPFFEAELRAAGAVERAEDVGVLAETCLLGEASTPEAQWVEGYTTMFGGPVAARTLPEPVVADPPLACSEVTGVAGKVAVVYRGVCPMIEKVRHAQTAGAVAAIIVNEGYVGALRASPDAFSNSIVIPAIMVSASSWEHLSALPEDTIFAWKPHTAEGSAWDDAAGILALKREDWPADEAQRRRWLEDVVQANHPSSPAGHWQRWEAVKSSVDSAGYGEELDAVIASLHDSLATGIAPFQEEPVDVETDVLAPLMMADITHRVLDSDGLQSEVPGADLLCAKFRDSFHIQEPFFKRGSRHASENHLRNLLRQQLCLEKLLILNAISAGQQMDYLRSQDVDAFEATTARLLREVKAPAARHALEVYEAIGKFAYTRDSVDVAVTVKEWLSTHKDVAPTELQARKQAGIDGVDKAADEAADEATVSPDGEWSV